MFKIRIHLFNHNNFTDLNNIFETLSIVLTIEKLVLYYISSISTVSFFSWVSEKINLV